MRALTGTLFGCVLAAVLPTAQALDIGADGIWYDFAVGEAGDVWRSPLDGEPISFSLNSASPFVLRVVDLGFAGDRVDVFANGATVVGETALVPVDDAVYAFTADEAFAAPAVWSQGQWTLTAGSYTFTGTALASPFGGGALAISALAVPEPSAWLLLLAGMAAVGGKVRRRR